LLFYKETYPSGIYKKGKNRENAGFAGFSPPSSMFHAHQKVEKGLPD